MRTFLLIVSVLGVVWTMVSDPSPMGRMWGWGGMSEAVRSEAIVEEVLSEVNGRRAAVGEGVLELDEGLMEWLRDRVVAGGGYDEVEAIVEELGRDLPIHVEVEARTFHAPTVAGLRQQMVAWQVAAADSGRYTGMGALVEADGAAGVRAIAIWTRKLPLFEPSLLGPDRREAEFSTRCSHCGHEHPVTVPRGVLGLQLTCPECSLLYDMLAQDLSGNYRHANQFLTGYDPPTYFPPGTSDTDRMLRIWRDVVRNFRYAHDLHGVQGQRDQWQLPQQTEAFGNGDCEDTSILLADRLISSGIEARVVLGFMTDALGNTEGHAWVVARIGRDSYLLESTPHETSEMDAPLVATLGQYYAPSVQFDRQAIYFRKNKGWTPEYWAKHEWVAVAYPSAAPPEGSANPLAAVPLAAWGGDPEDHPAPAGRR